VTRKAFGIMLAFVLAMVPVAMFSTSAVAADSNVRIIYTNNGNLAANIFVDGVNLGQLGPSEATDTTLAAGTHTVLACSTNTTATSGGTCTAPGVTYSGAANNITVADDSNYTFLIQVGIANFNFTNSLNSTGLGETRLAINNGLPFPVDVCVDGLKVITAAPGGGTTTELPDLTSEQQADFAVVAPSGPGCGTPSKVNFVAGTAFVLTLATTNPAVTASCTTACGQVLFVGQDTVPNNPNTVAFCNSILSGPASLSGFQPALKALVGDVDPTTTETIANTQPSAGDMQSFVSTYTDVINAGDASVPPSVADAWATATAGIRDLLTTFKLVNYDLSKLPVSAVKDIVLGANGVKLPGVPPDPDVVAATDAITAFVTGTCLASTPVTPLTPVTPAAPIAAGPRFTG
jgi:hypothetical protein